MTLKSEFVDAAHAASGAFETKKARKQILGNLLVGHLRDHNIQIRHVGQLKPEHVADWIESGQKKGLSKRTLQNRASAVRKALQRAGLTRKAAAMPDTRQLGIADASRKGTRRAITREEFAERIARVDDVGVRHALVVQIEFGLRQKEVVMGGRLDVLERWERELREGNMVRILEGTKTGKPRETKIVDRDAALAAVVAAKHVAESQQHGRLIGKPNLKEAMNRYNNQARAAGFVGELSSHSLRYAFAQASINRYQFEGFSYREALARTSLDLGHGEGRGRWIKHVYDQRNQS